MEDYKKNGEIALACEFLGALGLSVLSSIDRLRMGLIMKFYETYEDRRDELREVFNMPLKDANDFLTVRILDDELGFSGDKPGVTEDYIEQFRRNPQILAKYYSKQNPEPKYFIPMLKQSRYVKDPKGEKGYHEVIFNDCWISYIFPEKNFAILDIDLRERIALKSRCAAHIYEEACGYKFRFDSSLKYFDMDERKIRMKFGFDRFSVKGELREENKEYEFNSKGCTKSSDIYNKILKKQVENVIKEFYDSHELPFWIEVEKVTPRKYKKKGVKSTVGRPKTLQPPKYRFWVRFTDIQTAEAVEIKDETTPAISSDVKNDIYLFRITLGEILRVNGYPDKLTTDFSQKIADEVTEKSIKEPDLAYKARKKIEELPMKYSGKKVHDIFKLVQKVLWEFKKLGEDPNPQSKRNMKSKDDDYPDLFWPSDIDGQVNILKHNHQRINKIMNDCEVSPEHFDKVMGDFKIRLSKPDKSGRQSMKTEEEAWSYFNNWLRSSASNYEKHVIENDGDVKTNLDPVNERDWLDSWNKCLHAATNSQDRGLSMAFQLMYFTSFDETNRVVNIEVPAFVVRDYVLRFAILRFCSYLKTFFGEGARYEFTQKWSPGNTKTLQSFEEFYDHVKEIHDTTGIKWRDCQFEISIIDKIFTDKVKFESFDDLTYTLLLQVIGNDTYKTLETNYVNNMNDVFRRFYGNKIILRYRII